MPKFLEKPTRVAAVGHPPKLIDEYVGRVNTGEQQVSVAHMRSPAGWSEPGQRPEFDEHTIVLKGELVVQLEGGGEMRVAAGQGISVEAGEWIRYGTPGDEGAEYIAICLPAFTPETVHRDL